jgi:hypothetical protein
MRYRHQKSGDAVDMVGWDSVAGLQASLDVFRQRWPAKHANRMCGVGKMMKVMKMTTSGKRPRCGEPEETAEHVWVCQSDEAIEIRVKGMESV